MNSYSTHISNSRKGDTDETDLRVKSCRSLPDMETGWRRGPSVELSISNYEKGALNTRGVTRNISLVLTPEQAREIATVILEQTADAEASFS